MNNQTIPNYYRYIKDKKPVNFKPVEDGFITTAGNPALGSKYGNCYTTAPPIITNQDVKKK
jgi:hypothetical protein